MLYPDQVLEQMQNERQENLLQRVIEKAKAKKVNDNKKLKKVLLDDEFDGEFMSEYIAQEVAKALGFVYSRC